MIVLIIEDEQIAGEKLKDLIIKHFDIAVNIKWVRSVEDSIAYLKENSPNIIFSDIELLDGNAFEIYTRVKLKCPIIFCTAYNQFFLDAFKTNGIAYLLKPYTEDEFKEALLKYKSLFQSNAQKTKNDENLIERLQILLNVPTKKYKQTFTVKKAKGVYLLQVDEIAYFQAQGDFIFAFDFENQRHILNYSLSSMEKLIDSSIFFRINRSEIINFNSIIKYHAYIKNRLEIFLKVEKTTLYTSNSRSSEFRSWIESK